MAIKWNELKHKSSPEVRAKLKEEAHAELERIDLPRRQSECDECGALIQVGGVLTKGCDGCVRMAMQLRAEWKVRAKEKGMKIVPLEPWALERCRALGIAIDSDDWKDRKDIRVLS